jgi:holliday junction DNA helicase RuvA
MFHYIKGEITMKFDGGIVIEAGGIGYEINVPENSSAYSITQNEQLLLYTKVIYKEDDVNIYGFMDRDSLNMFCRLMTVNGVGAKAALAILSAMSLIELKKAIIFDDPAVLVKAQGIGKKIAQRIVLELKDKISVTEGIQQSPTTDRAKDEREEAIIGLITLGYSRSEAAEAVNSLKTDIQTAENYMKLSLQSLMRR